MAEKQEPGTQLDKYPRGGSMLTEVQEVICRRVMEGESVKTITSETGMPSKATVFNWLASDVAFRTGYWLAKQLYAETLGEEILEISDDRSEDWIEADDGPVFDKEHVQRSKLRVDSRKWLAGKLNPKRYGDASLLRIQDDDPAGRREYTREEMFARLAGVWNQLQKSEGEDE